MRSMKTTVQHRRMTPRTVVSILLVAALAVLLTAVQSFADVGISVKGAASLDQGEGYTVTVVFSGEDLGRVDGQATYDTSKLSYVSGGSSSGDNGYIELKEAGTGEDITFKLKFKAIGAGTTNINVSTNGIYNLEEELIGSPSSTQQVTINDEDVEPQEETEESTEPEETAEPADTEDSGQAAEPSDAENAASDDGGMPGIMKVFIGVAAAALVLLIALLTASAVRRRRR